jgi:Zn-dependent protease with chaperone function
LRSPDSAAVSRRPLLNPFALPSETTLRFILLVVAVLGTSLFISNWLYFSVSDGAADLQAQVSCTEAQRALRAAEGPLAGGPQLQRCLAPIKHRTGAGILVGTGAMVLLGVLLYLAWPAVKRRRRRLRPLAGDVPQVADAVAQLSVEAGLRRPPRVLWNPLSTSGGALAFGLPWRPQLALSAGLVAACFRDRPAFDAVLRHELAHLRNGDVAKTYLALAMWWALVLGAIAPLVVSLALGDNDAGTLWGFAWRLAIFAALVLLTRNALLRSRESYADLRASSWDGEHGALRRVLEAMPAPATGRLRRLVDVHPQPAQRRELVDDPAPLFRFDVASAFATGIAAGIAFPNVVSLLDLLTTATSLYSDVRTYAALLVAPWIAGVMTIGAWRATQAALARGVSVPHMLGPAIGLAAGLATGQALSLDAVVSTGAVAGIGAKAFTAVWIALLLAFVSLFIRWLVICAQAWLPAVRQAPRRALLAACLASSLVLAWAVGQFSAITEFVDVFRQTTPLKEELATFAATLPPEDAAALETGTGALATGILDLVSTREMTFAALAAVWAFPLSAWLVRRRHAGIDASPPPIRRALATAAVAGLAFFVTVLTWRYVLHARLPLAERGTDTYFVSFIHRMELVCVLLQAAVASAVVLRVRGVAAVPLGLMAACLTGALGVTAMHLSGSVAGCVDALSIRSGGGCTLEAPWTWLILKDWVNEGALASFVAIPLVLGGRWCVRRLGGALLPALSPKPAR